MTLDSHEALLALVEDLLDADNRRLQLRAAFPRLSLDQAERIIAACAAARSREMAWRAFREALTLIGGPEFCAAFAHVR